MKRDLAVTDHGSVLILYPRTEASKAWARESLTGRELNHCYTIEPWFAQDVLLGALSHGLTIGGVQS